MERGDITQHVTQRSVITLVPTIVLSGTAARYSKLLPLRQRVAKRVEASHLNATMIAWMEHTAYTLSSSFEVWHIAPTIDPERRYFEAMVERCEPYAPRSVSYWHHYSEAQAVEILQASPHLTTVFDADHDRLARCWPLRGHRLAIGGVP